MEITAMEAMRSLEQLRPIEGIRPLWGGAEQTEGANTTPFADIFQGAIDNVRQTEADKNEKEYLLAVGELDNPAELSIALSKFGASVDLLIQLRNRSLDAYSEMMRINL